MTGLTQEILCDAPAFNEGMEQFMDWCGDDCVCLTWGGDDFIWNNAIELPKGLTR